MLFKSYSKPCQWRRQDLVWGGPRN